MGEIFLKAAVITVALLLFIVPGFALKKLNMLGDGAKPVLSNILLYVCQPALILASFTVFDDEDYAELCAMSRGTLATNFGIAAAISAVSILIMFGLCKLIFIKYKNRSAADVYTYISMFSNCGFLGAPFIKLFASGNPFALMYLMVFNLVFAVIIWTLGVYLISHDRREISAKKVLLNPTMIASAVALLMFFVPQTNVFMMKGVKELSIVPSALSTMTAPLAMMLVGIALAEMPIKSLFDRGGVYVAGALRLIVAPFITFAIAIVFRLICNGYVSNAGPGDYFIFLAPVVAMAMSPASLIVAMAEHYGGERELASCAYVTDTLFSVITIPLVLMAVAQIWIYFVWHI